MVWESAIDLVKQQMVVARKLCSQFANHIARGTIAAVPYNRHRLGNITIKFSQQPFDIVVFDINVGNRTSTGFEITRCSNTAQLLNGFAKYRLSGIEHLETIVIRRIMRPGHHDASIGFLVINREIEHRSWPTPDPDNITTGRNDPFDKRTCQFGRTQPSVPANGNPFSARLAHFRTKCLAKSKRIGRMQGFAHDTAHIIFAQHGRIKIVSGRDGHSSNLASD